MNIVQLTASSSGGVAGHARYLTALLARSGHRVILAGPANVIADDDERPALWHTRAISIPPRPTPGFMTAIRQIRAIAEGADVLHAHGLRAGAAAALAIGRLTPAPRLVITLHNQPVGASAIVGVGALLERIVAARADAIMAVSGDLIDHITARGARNVTRALVPADIRTATRSRDQVRADLGIRAGEKVAVTVARLAPQKDLGTLLDAATLTPARWFVVGDGPEYETLAARIWETDIPVTLLGRRNDVPDLLAAADVAVSTAVWEGQPVWLQEALAAGTPIVATNAGGSAEVTGHEAAILIDREQLDTAVWVAAAVQQILTDPPRQQAMSAAARARAAQLPTDVDVATQLADVYGVSNR